MTDGIGIFWFRRDLRLTDNPALSAALAECTSVLTVYIDERRASKDFEIGGASEWWLHHSLHALASQLRECGSELTLLQGSAITLLPELCVGCGATSVYWNRLYEPHTVARDTQLKKTLQKNGIRVQTENARLLLEPWQVKTKTGGPYRVFTPYWRNAVEQLPPEKPLPVITAITSPKKLQKSLDLNALELLPAVPWDEGFSDHWMPGEAGAQESQRVFLKNPIAKYPVQRDFPALAGVSRLSPHLHFGEISPRSIWHASEKRVSSDADAIASYRRQLGWRDFAHHILYHYAETVDAPLYHKYANFPWRKNSASLVDAWKKGRTGIPIVDAGMRELWRTGWMHNRVRMIVASFLVKNIRADWRIGAHWFTDTLVDADLANNTMGWQWAAGCGADAAPYFRIFNPQRQGERFDKDGAYTRHWVPELKNLPEKFLHQPWNLPADLQDECNFVPGETYPLPVVDLKTSREEALAALKSVG